MKLEHAQTSLRDQSKWGWLFENSDLHEGHCLFRTWSNCVLVPTTLAAFDPWLLERFAYEGALQRSP